MDGGAVMRAAVAQFNFGAHGSEKVARGLNVANLRNIFQDHRLIGQQSGGHAGERGIFCAADVNSAEQRLPSPNDELIHREILREY